ncbi:MAG: hypothetical protein JST40_10720 [Armatimonadetes bacterium]|nr:hypothetical protein [Armatimonadota bacterium]
MPAWLALTCLAVSTTFAPDQMIEARTAVANGLKILGQAPKFQIDLNGYVQRGRKKEYFGVFLTFERSSAGRADRTEVPRVYSTVSRGQNKGAQYITKTVVGDGDFLWYLDAQNNTYWSLAYPKGQAKKLDLITNSLGVLYPGDEAFIPDMLADMFSRTLDTTSWYPYFMPKSADLSEEEAWVSFWVNDDKPNPVLIYRGTTDILVNFHIEEIEYWKTEIGREERTVYWKAHVRTDNFVTNQDIFRFSVPKGTRSTTPPPKLSG